MSYLSISCKCVGDMLWSEFRWEGYSLFRNAESNIEFSRGTGLNQSAEVFLDGVYIEVARLLAIAQ